MQNNISNIDVIKFFFKQAFKLKWFFILTIIGTLIVTGLSLLTPIYFKEIIDIISNTNLSKVEITSQINIVFIYFIFTSVGVFLTWRWLDYTIQYMHVKLDYNLSLECFNYIHKHSYNFFINNFAGAINKKTGRLIGSMQGLFDIFFRDIVRFIFSLSFVVVVLSRQNFYLGMGFFAWIIFFVTISLFLNKFRVSYVKNAADENSKVSGMYSDTIVNNYNISVFGSLNKEYNFIKEALNKWVGLEKKSIYMYIFVFSLLSIISLTGEIGLLYFSIKFWFAGAISIGTFVLILTYQILLSQQIFSLSFMFGRLSTNIGNAFDMLEILNISHEIQDIKDAKNLKITSGKIEFKNIGFYYNQNVKVFDNLNFTINSGEKIGIVGFSGSGKSSLIKLLFRFYNLNSGSILIDGQDISEVTQDSLRSQISIVPQDPILFHRSLRENITYAKENVTEEELIKVSKLSHSHEFISNLKQGYETLVGERGIKLSGGERQRVAIARAMLADNKIIVLDEATSSLDSESEKLIQDALEKLMGEKTMIVIAHRLSTIMKMDRIIVLDKGEIIEQGTHKELLEKSGTYKKLWDIQSGGFIGE